MCCLLCECGKLVCEEVDLATSKTGEEGLEGEKGGKSILLEDLEGERE